MSIINKIRCKFRKKANITNKLLNKIEINEVSDVFTFDYPDFCDAYISSAYWRDLDLELTDKQLDQLNDDFRDIVYEAVLDSVF